MFRSLVKKEFNEQQQHTAVTNCCHFCWEIEGYGFTELKALHISSLATMFF